MSLSTKILLIIGGIVLFSAMAFIIFKQVENANRQLAIQTQMTQQKDLIDGIVRSQTQWATKSDLDKFITDQGVNLKAIQDDLNKLNASVSAANTVVVVSNGQTGNNIPSTGTGTTNPNPDNTSCDPNGYQKKEQDLALSEDFGTSKVPIGTVGFSAWQKAPWSIDIKPREYDLTNVIGTDENQKVYVYNKFNVKVDGKTYEMPIKTASTVQEYPTAKFSFWNPRLFLGVEGGVGVNPVAGEFSPSLSVGIMSYGQYKTNPDFSVLEVGAGYGTVSKTAQIVVTPVAYNVGKHIPLMSNLYVGPTVSVGTDGNVTFGAGIRVGL